MMKRADVKENNRLRAEKNREKRKGLRAPTKRNFADVLLDIMLEYHSDKIYNKKDDYSALFSKIIKRLSARFDENECRKCYESLKHKHFEIYLQRNKLEKSSTS